MKSSVSIRERVNARAGLVAHYRVRFKVILWPHYNRSLTIKQEANRHQVVAYQRLTW